MKTTQLFFTSMFLLGTFFSQAQNVASTIKLTSGGSGAGAIGTGGAFYGYLAGSSNQVGGTNNTFLGNFSGNLNTTGTNNVFVGFQSGNYNSTGAGNVSIGSFSNSGNGNYNTLLGYQAGSNNSGSNNIMIGYQAGLNYSNSSFSSILYIHSGMNGGAYPLIWGHFGGRQLKFNGKVGVGNQFGDFPNNAGSVDVSNYNLFVNGGILTEEVRVMLNNQWADYVFEENYKLPSLEEVELFIEKHKHLPNVPSAKEISENGIELGEMAKIQQEKIEELMLYLIQQQKEIKELKEQVKSLLEQSQSTSK